MRSMITLALTALLLAVQAVSAGAQEQEPGTLRFAHEAAGAPEVLLELAGPGETGGLLGWWTAAPGATVDLVPEDGQPLAPGRYDLTIWPPGEEGTGGTAITGFDVHVPAAGVATVTYWVDDEQGRPLFRVQDADGERLEKPLYLGTLVLEHDAPGHGDLEVAMWPLNYDSLEFVFGTVAPGEVFEEPVDFGTHTLVLREGGAVVARTEFTITQDEVTLLRTSHLLPSDPYPPPPDEPSERPTEIRRPARVETGAGGSEPLAVAPAVLPTPQRPAADGPHPAALALPGALVLVGLALAGYALRTGTQGR